MSMYDGHGLNGMPNPYQLDMATGAMSQAGGADTTMNDMLSGVPPSADGGMAGLPNEMTLPMGMDMDLNGSSHHIQGFDAPQVGLSNPQMASQEQSQSHQSQQQRQQQQGSQNLSSSASFRSQQQHQQGLGMGQSSGEDNTEASETGPQSSSIPATGAGAGPLPPGFGVAPGQNGGSTLTEFTKRRNWAQRTVEEIKDFLHILDANGRIMYVSASVKSNTGYTSEDLVGNMFRDFVHPDDYALWMREFHESIASGNQLRFFYRFRKADQSFAIFECLGHPHLSSQAAAFGPNNPAGLCRGFFMMARPYPLRNDTLLDSFLEHKIENERLNKRITDLKKEEAEEALEQQNQSWDKNKQSRPSLSENRSDETPRTTTSGHSTDYNLMPPPSKPALSNLELTKQNLEEANASSKPDDINDKMARYEGATHIETIEMLTGLRYRDGERSKGISTGDVSPSLIRGDAGIAIPLDRDSRGGDKKKKVKMADEYVCTDCGTLDSPEWRKGPSGPKTLCNACGLRWAKKEKKKQAPHLQGQSQHSHTPQTSLSKENSQGST